MWEQAFNCTIEELKFGMKAPKRERLKSFNCTIEELKLLYSDRIWAKQALLIVP